MKLLKERRRVLIVAGGSKTSEYFMGLLPPASFITEQCSSAGEARRKLLESPPDLIVVDPPLKDEFGVEFAVDAASETVGVLLLVKSEIFDKVSYDVEDSGVLTLSKPNSRQMFYSAVKLLCALSSRLKAMEEKNRTLQNKMTDIRTVDRAKWLLIEKQGMSEPEAHQYILKQSMDARISRREFAESIIRLYDES